MLVKIHTLHIFAGISQWDQYLDEFVFKVFMQVRFHEKISSFLSYSYKDQRMKNLPKNHI